MKKAASRSSASAGDADEQSDGSSASASIDDETALELAALERVAKARQKMKRRAVGLPSDSEASEESEASEAVATMINHESRMDELTDEIKLRFPGTRKQAPWTEFLAVVSTKAIEDELENVHDDVAREMSFYNQTLSNVTEATKLMEKHGVRHERPLDYFAEMVKSDAHMRKIKNKLLQEAREVDEKEQRRKQRSLKKFGKQVQAEKLVSRAKDRKEDLDAIKKWRKDRLRDSDGVAGKGPLREREGGDAFPVALDQVDANGARREKTDRPKRDRDSSGPNRKREAKNAKYGFGGVRHKRAKMNNADTASDMSNYSLKANRKPHSGLSAKVKAKAFGEQRAKGKAPPKKRPGKSKRK